MKHARPLSKIKPPTPPSHSPSSSPSPSSSSSSSDSKSKAAANTVINPYTYRIGRGETGVLTIEPYKSAILPLWRFKTVPIARQSAQKIWERFEGYDEEGDFVGMDMCRKFLQMGMTRAKRYANHAGGRKYAKDTGKELEKSSTHAGAKEKLEASLIFREAWERAKKHEGYLEKKERFLTGQKEWEREMKRGEAGRGRRVGKSTKAKDEEEEGG